MNFELSEEQTLLAETIRRFVATHYNFDARAKIVASPSGHSEDVWAAIAEMGLLGLPFAEAHGGFGGTTVDVMLVMEAIGEGLLVEPYLATVGLGGRFVARAGSAAQQERILPALVGGNAVVVVASEEHPLAAIELAEALATSDVPGGAINILTGFREELAPWLAGHMDVNAIDLTGANGDVADLERLAADNVKRVVRSTADAQSPWEIESFLELKTVWHPIGL